MNFIEAFVFPFLAAVANNHGRLALCLALGEYILGSLTETLHTNGRLTFYSVVGSVSFKLSPVLGLLSLALVCWCDAAICSRAFMSLSYWIVLVPVIAHFDGDESCFYFLWASFVAWNTWWYGLWFLLGQLFFIHICAHTFMDVKREFMKVPDKFPEHQFPVWSLIAKVLVDHYDQRVAFVMKSLDDTLKSWDQTIRAWNAELLVRVAELPKRLEPAWLAPTASALERAYRGMTTKGILGWLGYEWPCSRVPAIVPPAGKTLEPKPKERVKPVPPPYDIMKELRWHANNTTWGHTKSDKELYQGWSEHVGLASVMQTIEDPVRFPIIPPIRRPPPPKPAPIPEHLIPRGPGPYRFTPREPILPRPVRIDNDKDDTPLDKPVRLPSGDSGSLAPPVLAPRQLPSPTPVAPPPTPVLVPKPQAILAEPPAAPKAETPAVVAQQPAPVQMPVTPPRPARDILSGSPLASVFWREPPDPTANVDFYEPERWAEVDVGDLEVAQSVSENKELDYITSRIASYTISGLRHIEHASPVDDDKDREQKDTEIPDASPESVTVQEPPVTVVEEIKDTEIPDVGPEPLPVKAPVAIPGLGNYPVMTPLVAASVGEPVVVGRIGNYLVTKPPVAVDPTVGVANTSSGHVGQSVVVAGPELDMGVPVLEQVQPDPVTEGPSAEVANLSSGPGDIDIPDAVSEGGDSSELSDLDDAAFDETFDAKPTLTEPLPQLPTPAVVPAVTHAAASAPSPPSAPIAPADFGFGFSGPASGPSLPLTVSVPEMQPVVLAPGAPPPIFANIPSFPPGWYSTTPSASMEASTCPVAPSPPVLSSSPSPVADKSPLAVASPAAAAQTSSQQAQDDEREVNAPPPAAPATGPEPASTNGQDGEGEGISAVTQLALDAEGSDSDSDDFDTAVFDSTVFGSEEFGSDDFDSDLDREVEEIWDELHPDQATEDPQPQAGPSSAPEAAPGLPWTRTSGPGRKPAHKRRGIKPARSLAARLPPKVLEELMAAKVQTTEGVVVSKGKETAITAGSSGSQASGSRGEASGSQAQASGSQSQAGVGMHEQLPIVYPDNEDYQQRYEFYRTHENLEHHFAVAKVAFDYLRL